MDIDVVDTPWYDIKHKNITKFLQEFFRNWKSGNHITSLLRTCRSIIRRKRLSSINIGTLNFTSATFETSLQKVCQEVFKYNYKLEYVITLLAFTIEVDERLERESWYATGRLISVLASELANTPFDIKRVYIEESSYSMFLLIIPTLFLIYFMQ